MIIELVVCDVDVVECIGCMFWWLQQFYVGVIVCGQVSGEIFEQDEQVLVCLFVCQIEGMCVLGKIGMFEFDVFVLVDCMMCIFD